MPRNSFASILILGVTISWKKTSQYLSHCNVSGMECHQLKVAIHKNNINKMKAVLLHVQQICDSSIQENRNFRNSVNGVLDIFLKES